MSNYTVQIKPNKTAVTSVQINKVPSLTLGQLTDVDASGTENGETLVYDSVSQKYVVKAIPVIRGGTF